MAKQKKGVRVPFTPEQLNILRTANASDMKRLADEWGRTYTSLRRKQYNLLHVEEDRIAKRKYKRKLKKKTKNEYKHMTWTLAEEQEILTSKLTDVELANKLGRSVVSIWAKRSRLMKKGKTNGHGYRKGDTEDAIPFPFAEDKRGADGISM